MIRPRRSTALVFVASLVLCAGPRTFGQEPATQGQDAPDQESTEPNTADEVEEGQLRDDEASRELEPTDDGSDTTDALAEPDDAESVDLESVDLESADLGSADLESADSESAEVFVPSEDISEDFAVPFPVDI